MTGAQLLDLNRSINDVMNDLYARRPKAMRRRNSDRAYKNTHHTSLRKGGGSATA